METAKLDNLKNIIDTRLKELGKRSFDKDIDMDGDETDEAQGSFMLNMIYEHSDRNNAEIAALYDAVQKIKDGEYGLCEECGEDIEFKRLTICPQTKYCIKCAEQIEKESRLFKSARM